MNKEKRITLRIADDIPINIIGEIVKDLPKSGVTIYTTSVGPVMVYKVDYRKTDIYYIRKTTNE